MQMRVDLFCFLDAAKFFWTTIALAPYRRCWTAGPDLGERWPSRLVATAAVDRVSTTIWSGGAAAGLYLGTGLILAFLVHTHYPGAFGLREWIRVVLSWPLIFFMRSKSEARRGSRGRQ